MSIHKRIASIVIGTTVFLVQTPVPFLQSPPTPAVQRSDPAVDAYVTFVGGKRLEVPIDRVFVVASLDRLVSAAEALAVTQAVPNENTLATAHRIRREIPRLRLISGDVPALAKEHWNVFMAAAQLVADVSRQIGPAGARDGVINALLTDADGLDYDYPLRWQPNNVEMYFDLASRALKQMTR
jgi:hypothetical protein